MPPAGNKRHARRAGKTTITKKTKGGKSKGEGNERIYFTP